MSHEESIKFGAAVIEKDGKTRYKPIIKVTLGEKVFWYQADGTFESDEACRLLADTIVSTIKNSKYENITEEEKIKGIQ